MHFADSELVQELEEPAAKLSDVRYWHKADVRALIPISAIGGKADVGACPHDVRF